MWIEEKVSASSIQSPQFSLCCQEGKVQLEKLLEAPEPLYSLLCDEGAVRNIFAIKLEFTIAYFLSLHLAAKLMKGLIKQEFLIPLGFLDRITTGLVPYYQLNDTKQDMHNYTSMMNGKRLMYCSAQSTIQLKAYWRTSTNSGSDFGQSSGNCDIVVKNRTGELQGISELHPLYMALQYPLLFPYGESGFHLKIPYHSNDGKRKTQRVTRVGEGTTLQRGEKLFVQYLLDSYTSSKEKQPEWFRFNQGNISAKLYNNIVDGDLDAQSVGKRIVLPSSLTGSARYMIQNYQDAMAPCSTFENPSLFITFTANTKWPDFTEMLSLIPRLDIICIVFKLKLKQLMIDLIGTEIFGKTEACSILLINIFCFAYVYTIEFRKRGLPHAHILLWLDKNNSVVTPEKIDDIISAEIPLKEENEEAYKLVSQHMLYGHCGKSSDIINFPCFYSSVEKNLSRLTGKVFHTSRMDN
ncbi:hypothetical protein V2J09_021937 [Rumex salicifolius]